MSMSITYLKAALGQKPGDVCIMMALIDAYRERGQSGDDEKADRLQALLDSGTIGELHVKSPPTE